MGLIPYMAMRKPKRHASAAWAFGVPVYRQTLNEMFAHVPAWFLIVLQSQSLPRNLVTMQRYLKWHHVVNNYSKIQMNFYPQTRQFQKNEGQICNQWRQIYSTKHIHREYNNFFPGGMVPLTMISGQLTISQKVGLGDDWLKERKHQIAASRWYKGGTQHNTMGTGSPWTTHTGCCEYHNMICITLL